MAGLVQASRRSLLSPFKTLKLHLLHPNQQFSWQPNRPIPNFLTQTQTTTHLSTAALEKSPFESNILRILRNEIQYQSDYAPPHQVTNLPPFSKYYYLFAFFVLLEIGCFVRPNDSLLVFQLSGFFEHRLILILGYPFAFCL